MRFMTACFIGLGSQAARSAEPADGATPGGILDREGVPVAVEEVPAGKGAVGIAELKTTLAGLHDTTTMPMQLAPLRSLYPASKFASSRK
jgi:hypothetical protein